jgi:hypothetical protein
VELLQSVALQQERDLGISPGLPRGDADRDEADRVCFQNNRTVFPEKAGMGLVVRVPIGSRKIAVLLATGPSAITIVARG